MENVHKKVSKCTQQKPVPFEAAVPEQMTFIKSGFNWFIKTALLHGKQVSPCPLLACGTSTLICKIFSFHVSLPEAFPLTLKRPPHLKVFSSTTLLVSLSTCYTGKGTFKGSTEDNCSSEKSLKRRPNTGHSSTRCLLCNGWSPLLHLPAQEQVPALGKEVA